MAEAVALIEALRKRVSEVALCGGGRPGRGARVTCESNQLDKAAAAPAARDERPPRTSSCGRLRGCGWRACSRRRASTTRRWPRWARRPLGDVTSRRAWRRAATSCSPRAITTGALATTRRRSKLHAGVDRPTARRRAELLDLKISDLRAAAAPAPPATRPPGTGGNHERDPCRCIRGTAGPVGARSRGLQFQEQEVRAARRARQDFKATAQVKQLWSASVGGGAPKLRLGLVAGGWTASACSPPATTARWPRSTRPTAGACGAPTPSCRSPADPARARGWWSPAPATASWSRSMPPPATIKWRSYINSEMLSAPVIAQGMWCCARWMDASPRSAPADGTQVWSAEQQVPRLSLRGTASPVIAGELVIAGFDNGRVHGAAAARRRHGLGCHRGAVRVAGPSWSA